VDSKERESISILENLMNILSSQWLSLRTKIILPYMLLALLLAIGAAYIGTRVVFDSIEERFVNQLIEAGKLSSEWMVREEDRLLETLRLITYAEGMSATLKAEDAEKLRELAYPITVNAREESVQILDAQGIALLSMYHRTGGNMEEYDFSRGDDSFKGLPFVQKIFQKQGDALGDKHAALVRSKRGIYFYVAGPILDDWGNLLGVVLIGKSTNTLAREIREATLAQVTLYEPNGSTLATTLFQAQPLSADLAGNVLKQQSSHSVFRDLTASDIAYGEIIGAWKARRNDNLGLIGAAFAKNFLVRLSQNTWVQILISVLAAVFLVLMIGLFVSNRISRPILNLGQAAARVADGDLRVQLQPVGGDEVAVLTQKFNQMVSNLQRSRVDLVAAYDTTLEGWAKTLDLRNHETETHSRRVVDLSLRLAQAMGIQDLDNIRRGALLHDIGKMAIPDEILLKPGPLTSEEWETMRRHPIYAVEVLQSITFLKSATDIPHYHHEKWDGTGYPDGLEGEQIPLAARIFAIVDVWDSLLSDRPYRSALPFDEALRIIQAGVGNHFDPHVAEVFFIILKELF
jgi:putative nucleotidyltransferase with HDIG domain